MAQRWAMNLIADLARIQSKSAIRRWQKRRRKVSNMAVLDAVERIYVLCLSRHLFNDDQSVCQDIFDIIKQVPGEGDSDVHKIRSFARAGADAETIDPRDAIKIIRSVVEARIVRPTQS